MTCKYFLIISHLSYGVKKGLQLLVTALSFCNVYIEEQKIDLHVRLPDGFCLRMGRHAPMLFTLRRISPPPEASTRLSTANRCFCQSNLIGCSRLHLDGLCIVFAPDAPLNPALRVFGAKAKERHVFSTVYVSTRSTIPCFTVYV